MKNEKDSTCREESRTPKKRKTPPGYKPRKWKLDELVEVLAEFLRSQSCGLITLERAGAELQAKKSQVQQALEKLKISGRFSIREHNPNPMYEQWVATVYSFEVKK
jgi:hypothetical protein